MNNNTPHEGEMEAKKRAALEAAEIFYSKKAIGYSHMRDGMFAAMADFAIEHERREVEALKQSERSARMQNEALRAELERVNRMLAAADAISFRDGPTLISLPLGDWGERTGNYNNVKIYGRTLVEAYEAAMEAGKDGGE